MELGHPVVVVVQQVFEQAAVTQATLLGGARLPVCSYPDPRPGDADTSNDARARGAVETIAGLFAACAQGD